MHRQSTPGESTGPWPSCPWSKGNLAIDFARLQVRTAYICILAHLMAVKTSSSLCLPLKMFKNQLRKWLLTQLPAYLTTSASNSQLSICFIQSLAELRVLGLNSSCTGETPLSTIAQEAQGMQRCLFGSWFVQSANQAWNDQQCTAEQKLVTVPVVQQLHHPQRLKKILQVQISQLASHSIHRLQLQCIENYISQNNF